MAIIKNAKKLTKDADSFLEAKDTNDIFVANLSGNANTFQSGDEIDGGKGIDTLNIVLGNESQFAISAETAGIEIVSVRSQSTNTDGNSGDNNVSKDSTIAIDTNKISDDGDESDNVIDAQGMVGVKQFWNTDSRADLVIEDVRTAKGTKTEAVTIGWQNADPASMSDKVDYEVYFSPESLRKSDGKSVLEISWMDVLNANNGKDPLTDLNYNGFSFTYNKNKYTIQDSGKDTAIGDAKTYEALFEAISDKVSATAGLEDVVVSMVEKQYVGSYDQDGEEVPYDIEGSKIVLTSSTASLTSGKNIAGGESDGKSVFVTDISNPKAPGFITSTVVLDNVGRESESGSLVIGSMSTRSGVEKFKVDVSRQDGNDIEGSGSWVASMSSTNEKLQEVVITKNDGDYLYIGTGMESSLGNNLTVDRSQPDYVNTDGLNDVRVFDASIMTGNVKVGAKLDNTDGADGNESGKYNLSKMSESTKGYYDADGDKFVDFNYTTGSGDDTINLAVSDQCDVNIKTADGNDAIQLNVSVVLDGQININVGSGNNSIILDNEGTTGWSADTIEINTVFGANTVKNFNATNDKLDFTKYATKDYSAVETYTSKDVVKEITAAYKTEGSFLVLDLDDTTAKLETDYNAYSVEVDAKGVAKVTLIGNIDIGAEITTALLA